MCPHPQLRSTTVASSNLPLVCRPRSVHRPTSSSAAGRQPGNYPHFGEQDLSTSSCVAAAATKPHSPKQPAISQPQPHASSRDCSHDLCPTHEQLCLTASCSGCWGGATPTLQNGHASLGATLQTALSNPQRAPAAASTRPCLLTLPAAAAAAVTAAAATAACATAAAARPHRVWSTMRSNPQRAPATGASSSKTMSQPTC